MITGKPAWITKDEARKHTCGTIGGSYNRAKCEPDECIMWVEKKRKHPDANDEEGSCRHLFSE
jgi:hypothetical protein